ncbi:MAG: GIY-YIG nuclease family protein [Patescibacteria group bacterium]
MKKIYRFFIYILASDSGTLYVGLTNNIYRRIEEHKTKANKKSFSKKYNCYKLVYFEEHKYVNNAINREKEIKDWNRKKKEELTKKFNPHWIDLYDKIDLI